MATVTALTAERTEEIEAASIVGVAVNSTGHVVLITQGGDTLISSAAALVVSTADDTFVTYNGTNFQLAGTNIPTPAGTVASAAPGSVIKVVHGSTASTARGSSRTDITIWWVGSVQPTNALSGDFWLKTA